VLTNEREILSDVISKNGGLVFTKSRPAGENGSNGFYVVVPYTLPREDVPSCYEDNEIVTEMWIERCMVANTTFNPRELIMCTPMPGPFPRPCIPFSCWSKLDLKNLAISISGFSGADLLHVELLLTLLGVDYYDTLTRNRSLLLVQDNANGPKMEKAVQWGIPVVRLGWLWAVISQSHSLVDIAAWSDNPNGKASKTLSS
jgi:DNA replication regulator DPB11